MSIKFLYATDLHGNRIKYATVLKTAKKLGIKMIHLGADLLPKDRALIQSQKEFVHGFLREFFEECKTEGIKVLCFFGNDDLYFLKNEVRALNDLLDETPITIEGFEFKAYGYVPDYPFALKTGCKLDLPEKYSDEAYLSEPVCVNGEGIYYINDIKKYFKEKGTIQQDLQILSGDSKTIMAFHCPPVGLDLDVCGSLVRNFLWDKAYKCPPNTWIPRKTAGSEPIRKWIEEHQPQLVLCGHIHESFAVTKKWKAMIGNTLVIQPGQLDEKTTMVAIEVGNDMKCELIQRTNYAKTTGMAVKKGLAET